MSQHGHPDEKINEDFDFVVNFRDVGKTVNRFMKKRYMKEGVLYRSARIDDASEQDQDRLLDDYHIKLVMDLRTSREHANQNRQTDPNPGPSLQPPQVPIHLPGTTYLQVPVTGRYFELALLLHLRPWILLAFLFHLLLGRHDAAIRILARDVLIPLGLAGGSTLSLRTSWRAYLLALDTMTVLLDTDMDSGAVAPARKKLSRSSSSSSLSSSSGLQLPDEWEEKKAALIHCTAGKDRTGTMTLLVLLILGVPVQAIQHDYMATSIKRHGVAGREDEQGLGPGGTGRDEAEEEGNWDKDDWEKRLQELKEFGFPASWLETDKNFVGDVAAFLDERWGGIEGYCDWIGFGAEKRERLKGALLATA